MMRHFFRKSIYRQYLLLFICFMVLFLLCSSLLSWYDYRQKISYLVQIEELTHKQRLISEIEDNLNHVLFEGRGYLAFHRQEFLSRMEQEKEDLREVIALFQTLPLDEADHAYLNAILQFSEYYFDHAFHIAITYVKENNQQAIEQFSASGVTHNVNEIRTQTTKHTKQIDDQIMIIQAEYHQNINQSQYIFFGFIVLIILVLMGIAVRMAKNVGVPLSHLALASDQLARGEYVDLSFKHRQDELGALSRSFENMVQHIQENEQELVAQNEELLAQQDELQAQQIELEFALEKMNQNKQMLERRNHFNLSLATTLDQQELLQSIIENISSLMDADKACIVLVRGQYDYAHIGISENGMKQFITHMLEGILPKVYAQKDPYIVSREAVETEKGYHEEMFILHDLIVPVLSHEEEVVALIVLTRMGKPFNADEKQEMKALARQISVTLDKLTLYKQTEQARKINQDIINSVREGIQLVDERGRIRQVNRQWGEMMGQQDISSVKGFSIQRWLPMIKESVRDHAELVAFMLGVIHDQFHDHEKVIYQTNEESPRFIQVYFETIYNGQEKIGTIFVHRDMTSEYEIDRMKSELVSTVSHELRTPLSSVLGFTELMLTKDVSSDKQKKYLATIQREAQRLTSLINDFLDVQRMEAGKQSYSMHLLHLEPIIEEIIEAQALQTTKHSIHYQKKIDPVPMMKGDPDRIKQVFTNLMNNAIKYSPNGGTITISAKADKQHLIISISDEGLGIPEEALPLLFNKFSRIDNTDRREIGGTGLGLAISKEIMKAHSGKIKVESSLGKGSIFSLYFPLP